MICRERRQAEEHAQKAEIAVLEEPNRMAREIHDTLAQSFTGNPSANLKRQKLPETGLPADWYAPVVILINVVQTECYRSVLN